ncbi:MAG: hypothetical protein ABI400_11270 [Lacisediminihabitans sp.]
MRWDNLFDDLESQLEHELTAEEIDLRAEEERLRLARMSLRDRIVALHAHATENSALGRIRMRMTDETTLDLRPLSFGKDWFSAEFVEVSQRHQKCIVPIAAITGLLLQRAQVEPSLIPPAGQESSLSARLGLAFVLRDLCRRRASIELRLLTEVVRGTIDRVGRDHLDLAVHEPGSPRREAEVSHYRVVPFSQLLLVRT